MSGTPVQADERYYRLLSSVVENSPYTERFALDLARQASAHVPGTDVTATLDLLHRMEEYVAGRTGPHLRLKDSAEALGRSGSLATQAVADACLLRLERAATRAEAAYGIDEVFLLILRHVHDVHGASAQFALDLVRSGVREEFALHAGSIHASTVYELEEAPEAFERALREAALQGRGHTTMRNIGFLSREYHYLSYDGGNVLEVAYQLLADGLNTYDAVRTAQVLT